MTQLHYSSQNFELADDESAAGVKMQIELKVRERGGWVDVKTVDGDVSLLVSAGIPIFVVDRRHR